MNSNCLNKLEYNKILESLSAFCSTYIGKDLALGLLPSNNKKDVKLQLNETNEAVNLIKRLKSPPISEIDDISYYLKLLENSNAISSKGLLSIASILEMSQDLQQYFYELNFDNSDNHDNLDGSDKDNALKLYFDCLYSNPDIVNKIKKSIIDENTIADNASKNLNAIRKKLENMKVCR